MFHNIAKKQIILVRHAKAVEKCDWQGIDFDRPLTPAWESANKIVANYLRLIGIKPERIIASPAVRTRDTARDIAKKFNIEKVEYPTELYNEWSLPSRDSMGIHMKHVQSSKKWVETLMIVGHNPDLTEFASYLSGEAVPSMKKGSIMVLSLPDGMEWKSVAPGKLKFVYYLTPHFLRLEELV